MRFARAVKSTLATISLAGALATASTAYGHAPIDHPSPRKTTAKDLAIDFEKLVLPNGLTVLMSSDPSVSGVVVDLSFHAGSIYEPPGRVGSRTSSSTCWPRAAPRTPTIRPSSSRTGGGASTPSPRWT